MSRGDYRYKTARVGCWNCQEPSEKPADGGDDLIKSGWACRNCGQWNVLERRRDRLQSRPATSDEMVQLPAIMLQYCESIQKQYAANGKVADGRQRPRRMPKVDGYRSTT